MSFESSGFNADLKQEFENLVRIGWKVPRIHETLEQDPRFSGLVPSERQLYRWMREFNERVQERDLSSPWIALEEENVEKAKHALKMLGELYRHSHGGIRMISHNEADIIHRIWCLHPLMDFAEVWSLVQRHLNESDENSNSSDLNLKLIDFEHDLTSVATRLFADASQEVLSKVPKNRERKYTRYQMKRFLLQEKAREHLIPALVDKLVINHSGWSNFDLLDELVRIRLISQEESELVERRIIPF